MTEVINNVYTIIKIVFVLILCYISVKWYIQKENDHLYNEVLERIFDSVSCAIKESELDNFDIVSTKAYTKFYKDINPKLIIYLNKNYSDSHEFVKMKIISSLSNSGYTGGNYVKDSK